MMSALKSEAALPRAGFAEIRPAYLDASRLVERLHRRLLDVIKDEFDRRGRSDVNPVQALLLYNISDKELTAGELRTRGYYLGSNVSYNVKKLVETGYLHHSRSRIDRRAVRISLTDKGRDIHTIVSGVYDKHVATVEQIGGIKKGSWTDPVKRDEALKEAGGVQPYLIYVGIAFYVLFILTMIKMLQDGPPDGERSPEKPARPTAASSV